MSIFDEERLAAKKRREAKHLRPAQRKMLQTGFSVCVREARVLCGFTQAEVAVRLGLATEVYARMERGSNLPSVPTLQNICRVLRVSADKLLGLSE